MSTLKSAWALTQKDLLSFFRDRTALLLSFLLPIALVSVFGWIMAYAFGGGSGGMPKIELHVADLSRTDRSAQFVTRLKEGDMLRVRPIELNLADDAEIDRAAIQTKLEQLIRDGDAHHVLVIPSSYDEALDADQTPEFAMLRDPGRGMEDQLIQLGIMQASISELGGSLFTDTMERVLAEQGMDPEGLDSIRGWMTDIGDSIGSFYETSNEQSDSQSDSQLGDSQLGGKNQAEGAELAATPKAESEDSNGNETGVADSTASGGFDANALMGFMSEVVPMETTDVSPPNRAKQVTYQQAQSVAGMSVMMLLFALTSCGSILLLEKEEGTLRRLFAQPISRNAILLGKFWFVMIVGIAQMTVLFLYGEWMFRVGLFSDPVTLVVLSLTWVAVGSAFGLFLASVSSSRKQAESLASLLILMMAALGGCWFPLQLMSLPPLLETVCKSTMTFWAMSGFQGMLWNQLPWHSEKMLLALGWQWGWALALGSLTIFFFRRNFCRG